VRMSASTCRSGIGGVLHFNSTYHMLTPPDHVQQERSELCETFGTPPRSLRSFRLRLATAQAARSLHQALVLIVSCNHMPRHREAKDATTMSPRKIFRNGFVH